MEQLGPALAIGGVLALIGGIVYLAWLMEKKRTEAMSAWAQSHGYQFEGLTPGLIDELSAFKLFNQGRSRTAKNTMRGAKEPGALRICDYQFTTGSGKHQQVHQQTIVVLKTPGRQAPHFFLRRQRSLFDALGKVFGGQDINFDEDPAFSKAFVLQGADEGRVRDLFTSSLREFFMRFQGRNFQIEARADFILFHEGRYTDPGKAREIVERAFEILNVLS